ncbi:MAG: alpha/beta hydrolase [Bacteroidetes bacterium]|jgi:acetyl esterase|nr:alpha/beta hydrolase [Bacteroidota bacterium]MBT4398113.1 alpha/beta hydrolase [Bacteroidota bacterium]MBT5426527.1 alpha/beta hydrolase [Bacteroidota bacterium]MBT7465021.1 alpha/beta hydrolase [Bacteroidota bacterium]
MLFTGISGELIIAQNADISDVQSNEIVYKQIDTTQLKLTLFYPPDIKEASANPAIVFFFGGGWVGGSISQFEPHAKYFASRGMVSILADYRTAKKHGTSPFDAVADAKSAMRFIRKHSKNLNIDANQIIASGGSAGGHLAAATGIIEGLDDPGDDLSVSCVPNAMVLFNPVIDNGPDGYGYDRVAERYLEISPLHSIKEGCPPCIFFLGSKDKLIPVETGKLFKEKLEAVGSRCDLHIHENQGHGFFNLRNYSQYAETVYQADLFLSSLGYLDGEPSISW